jgi:hypothetical protein
VDPLKDIEKINPYGLVILLNDVENPAMVRAAMNPTLPPLEVRSPPGLKASSHMLKVNPPKRHPRPCNISTSAREAPPTTIPPTIDPATYAPWIFSLTGRLIT